MVDKNVTQFATIFDAVGCVLRYNSADATISVIDTPKGMKELVHRTLGEIKHFDMTANFIDGMSALCVADFIDDVANPIDDSIRDSIMHALGVMKDGKYIHQTLMLQKNNRSWHFSEVENDCSHFGEECTHRGVNPNPDRKGRRSNRKPDEYHMLDGKGDIKREQLVTTNLEDMFKRIPTDVLVSGKIPIQLDRFDLVQFKKLPVDKKLAFISDLQGAIHE